MRHARYDFVLGIGSACIASQALREAGLQHASYPFDWMSGPSFTQRIQTILSDFADWFNAEDLEFQGNPNGFTHDSYRNRRTNALYPHDFDPALPFDEAYPRVKEKYARRISRLNDSIRRSARVLVVWLENPSEDDRPADGEVVEALRALCTKFPATACEFLIIDRAKDDGRSGEIERKEYGWRVSCGYRRKTNAAADARPWELELQPIVAILKRFRVCDNRTPAERRAYAQTKRRERYASLHATSWLEFQWVKLQLKIYRHLAKRLQKRGVNMQGVM